MLNIAGIILPEDICGADRVTSCIVDSLFLLPNGNMAPLGCCAGAPVVGTREPATAREQAIGLLVLPQSPGMEFGFVLFWAGEVSSFLDDDIHRERGEKCKAVSHRAILTLL